MESNKDCKATTSKESQISSELYELQMAISSSQETIEELTNRIEPALRQAEPEDKVEERKEDSNICQLADTVRQRRKDVNHLHNRLMYILEHLEI